MPRLDWQPRQGTHHGGDHAWLCSLCNSSLIEYFPKRISLILIRSVLKDRASDLLSGLLCGGLGLGGDQTCLSLVPVDNLPDVLEVLRASVLVVDVVGVLPDVNADDGHDVGADVGDGILVGGSAVREGILSLVVHEPSPAGTLDSSGAGVEHVDEVVEGTPAFDHGVEERTVLGERAVSWSAEGIPENSVVKMTTTVELNALGKGNGSLEVAASVGLGLLLHQLVKVVDVGAMMSAVMDIEGLSAHDGLKRSNLVRQMLQGDAGNLSGSTEILLNEVVNHSSIV